MNSDLIRDTFERGTERRAQRREFIRMASGIGAAVAGGSILAACGGGGDGNNTSVTPTPTPSSSSSAAAVSDADILNFALNLEYLEAEFYQYAVGNNGLPASSRTAGSASGTFQGTVIPGRAVTFTDPLVRQYAREIAADELAHVNFLRSALGTAAVAEPAIDVGFGVNNAFSNAARAAGLITANQVFDPYASDEAFLLGAFLFEDVGVTAYAGAAPLLTSKVYLEAAAGILAAEAYHAGLVRTVLYRKGITVNGTATSEATPTINIGNGPTAINVISATEAISNLRDSADNSMDDDQGLRGTGSGLTGTANLVPTDGNALAYARSTGDVLNIVYLSAASQSTSAPGSFFPGGVNGNIRTSSAFV